MRANPSSRQSLRITKKRNTETQLNSSYATALAVQASIYQKRADPKTALKFIDEALSIHQKLYGEQHPRVIRDLYIKAQIYRDLKMNARATKLLQRAMSISKNLLGKEHPFTLKIQKQYDSFTKGS